MGLDSLPLQLADQIQQQPAGSAVEIGHPGEVQEDVCGMDRVLQDRPEDGFEGGEDKAAAELVDADGVSVTAEEVEFVAVAEPFAADLGTGLDGLEGGGDDPRGVEEVESEIVGEVGADPDAADAVAFRIEGRGKDADAELAGQDGEDAAGDAAFGGHADIIDPFAGVVIHAARSHDTEETAGVVGLENAPLGEGIDSAVGQGRRHHGQIPGGDGHRTLLEIEVERLLGVAGEDGKIAQEMRDGAVAVAGVALGNIDRLIHIDIVPREFGEELKEPFAARRRGCPRHEAGGRDAPALIIGFNGRPVCGSRLIELKASPEGSTPTRERTCLSPATSSASPYTSGLEIDWMVNGVRLSPTS